MDIYRRYFKVTSGPMFDFIAESEAINDEANEQYKAILDEVGASQKYYHRGRRMTGMIFECEPDRTLFKKRGNGWWPKKNSKKGKDLNARLIKIRTQDPNDALKLIGLRNDPTIFGAGKCYYPTLLVIPEETPTIYISVPWYDEDPAEIAEYKQMKADGLCFNGNIEAIMWEPTPEMIEIKGWEVDRHIDEYNESIKAE